MKKSPGKWIKGVIFGKKPSKGKTPRSVSVKGAALAAEFPEPVISLPTLNAVVKAERDAGVSIPIPAVPEDPVDDETRRRLVASATAVQASFRGYLARRAFRTLKGIIRLQALVRGHFVRRQAVATLCCVYGIVKFQARFRGRRIRSEGGGISRGELSSFSVFNTLLIAKTTSNSFVRQILSSSPNVMPLKLQYDFLEPNSAPSWLDRWSSSCFWKPERTSLPSKIVKKHARPKRSVRRIPPNANEQKRVVKSNQESPQSELEKVKRNLRKINSNVAQENPDSEVVPEEHKPDPEAEAEPVPEPPLTEEHVACELTEEKKEEANGEVKAMEGSEKAVKKSSSIPSYMLATESAKAKLRSWSLTDEGSEKDNGSRRHSLPSANSKARRGSSKKDGKGEWKR